jgi:hypothetical protein
MFTLIGLVLASVLVSLVVIGLIARSQSYEDPRGPAMQMFKAIKPGQQPKGRS